MRAYHRVDPIMDERKSHYTPAQLGSFLKVQLMAGRQTRRGRFRSVAALKSSLAPPYARSVDFLVEQGDIIPTVRHEECKQCPDGPIPRGEVYVDGWDEWQEGDLTVRDRMARLRNRKRNNGVTTASPDRNATVTTGTPDGVSGSVGVGVGVGSLTSVSDTRAMSEVEKAAHRLRNGNATEPMVDAFLSFAEQLGDAKVLQVAGHWESNPVRDRYGSAKQELEHLAKQRRHGKRQAVEPLTDYDAFMVSDDDEPVAQKVGTA